MSTYAQCMRNFLVFPNIHSLFLSLFLSTLIFSRAYCFQAGDDTFQPPLQLHVAMWLNSGQWNWAKVRYATFLRVCEVCFHILESKVSCLTLSFHFLPSGGEKNGYHRNILFDHRDDRCLLRMVGALLSLEQYG